MADEPEFVRLFLPTLNMWITAYTINAAGLQFTATGYKPGATVYLSPKPGDIETIKTRFADLQLENATFAEWIEHGGKPEQ